MIPTSHKIKISSICRMTPTHDKSIFPEEVVSKNTSETGWPSNLKYTKPSNKILKILILGGGPIGLFMGYKLLKRGNDITIFEKRKKYTRHNILSLKESRELDTLSLIPSEIIEELNHDSSFSYLSISKASLDKKPYLMASSRSYYFVLNELEMAYEKHFKKCGGIFIRPQTAEYFTDIHVEDHLLKYTENQLHHTIDMASFDIILINDGANSYYREIYFKKTSYLDCNDDNIFYYGLPADNSANPSTLQRMPDSHAFSNVTITHDLKMIKPLAYGLIIEYEIKDRKEFREKFHTKEKLERATNSETICQLEHVCHRHLDNLSVKEILEKSTSQTKLQDQNLSRMFISRNYLYISIMISPNDVADYFTNMKHKELKFTDLPKNIQTYVLFSLYYYDLGELINPELDGIKIKMFPLFFSCVNQTGTFIKNNERYQFLALCGDAMASGNFHAGIILNRNLLAVNYLCQLIEEYIDSYPKNQHNELRDEFLRLLFFHVNLSNQKAVKEIIEKSFINLINFSRIDKDKSTTNLHDILTIMGEVILCKNENKEIKLACKNSLLFIQFLIDHSKTEVLQRIFKYLV